MTAHTSFFENVLRYVDHAASFSQQPKGLLDQIKHCNSVYHFEFPLRHHDGTVEVISEGLWKLFNA